MKKTYITSALIMAVMAVSMTGCGNSSVKNTSADTKEKTVVSESTETTEKQQSLKKLLLTKKTIPLR